MLIFCIQLTTTYWVLLTILSSKKPNFQTKLEPVCHGILYSFFRQYYSSNIAKLISNSEVCINRKVVGLFHDVLHYVWPDYYGLYHGTHRIHKQTCIYLGNHLNVERSYQCLYKYCSYMPLLISNSETAKYLHKVDENLIFLFTPIYFIVRFGRHSEL